MDPIEVPQNLAMVTSSRTEFVAPALAAVARWRFRPATMEGRPVATRMEVPVSFELRAK